MGTKTNVLLGIVGAVGVGYLAWRFLLSPQQKEKAAEYLGDGVRTGQRMFEETMMP